MSCRAHQSCLQTTRYLLNLRDADEQESGGSQRLQRTAANGCVNKIAHDLGVEELQADAAQEEYRE